MAQVLASANSSRQASISGDALPDSRAASVTSRLLWCTSRIDACEVRSPVNSFSSLIVETALAIGPASSTDRKTSRSSPWLSAKWNASASPVTWVMRKRLTASFIRVAPGTSPQRTVVAQTGARSGTTSSTVADGPATIPTS